MKKQKCIPYTRVLSGDSETPITLYAKYVGDNLGFLLESKEPGKGRYSFIGKKPYAVLESKNDEIIIQEGTSIIKRRGRTLDVIKEYMACFEVDNHTSLPFVGGAVGGIAYDVIRQYEKLPDENPDELHLPDVHLMFVKTLIVYDHFHDQIVLVTLQQGNEEGRERAVQQLDAMEQELKEGKNKNMEIPVSISPPKGDLKSHMAKDLFLESVKRAKKYIFEGDIFQVVLSRRSSIEIDEDSFALYRQLRAVNPSAYLFYLNFEDYQVVGSSPEMLVEFRKDKILTCPIAGTRPRGKDSQEDEALEKDMLEDEKELAEHAMLVDLARNDMGRVSRIGSVHMVEFMKVKYYSHVMHLVSLVEGKKEKNQDAFSILSTFLPAGTLSGAPKIRAMEIIEELEDVRRGLYGGAVGYFGFDGDMDMCIAIRMMIISGGKAYLQAGAGIVADSDPEKEYQEIENKLKALEKVVRRM